MASRYNSQRITVDILSNQAETAMEEETESADDEPMVLSQAPLKRKLLDEFDINRPSIDPPPDKHMKVYLRIRPFSAEEINRNEKQDCLSVENEHIVSTHPPKDSHTYRNATRGLGKTMTKFTFSHIFNENTSQKDFFNDTMLGLVKDFIDGQNCLVFSYGVTSSGKTYTIQGNPKDAGILPRALDVLFNSISGQQWEPMNLKPKMFMGVQRLTSDEELKERKVKERVLKLSLEDDMDVMSLLGDDASDVSVATNTTTCSESSNISSMDFKESIDSTEKLFAELNNRVREEARVNVQDQGNIKFSVWVSFAEIYNEQIFDLLEPMPKKKNARRPCLKLSEDKNGSPYIKGLKEVNVNSADEAYKLLTIGQRNLKTACTKLNHNSSRSHCIFNIKILRVVDKESPHVARVSMLSLCDLAGSERYTKSQTSGERLKEAGNINTSLLTLGRCIETLRYNQQHKENTRIVPFRDSKLTRLFQNFFVGRGKAAMIVNVNQCASMFDETLHVFKFSAIANQVVVVQKPVFIKPKLPVVVASPNPIPRTSIMWATPARTSGLPCENEAANVPLPECDDEDLEQKTYTQENIDELIGIIDGLQNELSMEKYRAMKMEATIRTEVVEEMKKQFIDIEQDYSDQVMYREQLAEELAEKRIQILVESKQTRNDKSESVTDEEDEWVSSVLLHQEKVKVERQEKKINDLTEKITDLDSKIHSLTEGQEKMEKERNNLAKQLEDSQKINDELQKELSTKNTSYMENLQKQLTEYEDKIREMEQIIEKGKETEETDQTALIENLTQQLTQSRSKIRDQEKEISELNDMLTEAGETFEQRETELQKLKDLVQEYEKRLETQSEAIKVLEQAADDGRVAMETADQSLSKREECVAVLQSEIRELQGDVQKYRNKARFFEESVVEREQETLEWKHKYEQDKEEHSKSQEALIHGFTAEISSLKSQIFHFKTQLYSVKSPTKSPGGALKSPDVKSGFLFSPDREIKTLSTPASVCHKKDFCHNVQEELMGLQSEMDKNVASISELEHALHISRSGADDLEKKLTAAEEKIRYSVCKIETLEAQLKLLQEKPDQSEINEYQCDLTKARQTISDLQNEIKAYVEKVAKLAESESELHSLNEKLILKNKLVFDLENRQRDLEKNVSELKQSLQQREDELEKLEQKKEELEVLNAELKDMVNKTTNDLQTKEIELQILSPKSVEKNQKVINFEKDSEVDEMKRLRTEVESKCREIERLKEKVGKLKAGFKAEEILLTEANNKYSELEFRIDEKEIENQDLKRKKKEYRHKIEDLNFNISEKSSELTKTGEELAIAKNEIEKFKRIIAEKDAIMFVKESALTEMKDKISLEKQDASMHTIQEKSDSPEKVESLKHAFKEKTEEIRLLQEELMDYKTKDKLASENLTKMDAFCEEILKLKGLIKGKEEKISELVSKTKSLHEEVDRLNSDLKENQMLEKEIQQLKSSLLEKEEEMAMLSDNLSAVLDEKEEEEKYSVEAAKLKTKVFELETQLKEKEQEILKVSKTVSLKDNVKNCIGVVESQENAVNDLQNKLEILAEQLQERENVEVSLRDLESAVADKEVELCNKDKEIECKVAEVDCLRTRIESLEMELKTRSEESNKLKDLKEPVSSTAKKLEAELEGVKHQLSDSVIKAEDLKTTLKNGEEKIKHVEKENRALTTQIQEKIACIEAKEKEIYILEGKVKCVLEKNNNLEEKLEEKSKELKEQMSSYNEMIKEHKTELDSAKQHLSATVLKTEELNVALKNYEEKKDNLDRETDSLKVQLNEKVAYIESKEKEICILEDKVKCLQEKNNDLEQTLEEKARELEEQKSDYNESKKQNDLNSAEVSKLTDAMLEIAELKSVVHSHKTLHHKVKGELEEALLELENKRSEINSLWKENDIIKKLEGQIDVKDIELKEALSRNVDLQTELEKLKDRTSKIKELQDDLERSLESMQLLKNENKSLTSDLDRSLNRERELENMLQDVQCAVDDKVEVVLEMKKNMQSLLEEKENSKKDSEKETEAMKSISQCKTAHHIAINKLIHEIKTLKQDRQAKIEIEAKLKSAIETEVAKITKDKEEEIRKLTVVIDDLKCENCEIKNSLQEIKSEKTLENAELEENCKTLKTELSRLKDSLLNEENQGETLREEIKKLEKLYGSQKYLENKCDNENNFAEKFSELQTLYNAEKVKNEEYQKILNEMNEQNILSPQSGVRRLRKEKIDVENALIEARFTITSLEKKLNDAELRQEVQGSNQQNSNACDYVLQQKLNKATSKLHEVESNNRSLIKEVTQLQGMVEQLEDALKEERHKYEMIMDTDAVQKTVASVIQTDPRQSISSPSTKTELCKSREREHALHEQLNKTKSTIQEWSVKFTNIEKELQQKTEELQKAKDNIATLERTKSEGSKLSSEELEKYQERVSELEKDIIKKEEQLDSNAIHIADLKQQLETGVANMKNFKQDVKSKDETIAVLKETLGEQENMLQLQEEYINNKEAEISSNKTEYQSLLDKYQSLLESKNSRQHEHLEEARLAARAEAERDLLKKQLEEAEFKLQRAVDDRERTNQLMKEEEHRLERVVEEKDRTDKNLTDMEHRLQKAVEERDRSNKALKENNQELKDMEKTLTEVRKECEDLKSQGSDKHAETRLEDLRHDLEKKIHELEHKNKELHAELKDVKAKFHMTKETLKVAVEEQRNKEKSLVEFREERDKLVSGLEAILKKKDVEIKQHKDLIIQLKEREAELTKSWQEERQKIGAGLQQLEKNVCKVKKEPVDDDYREDNCTYKSPVRKGSYREAMTPLSPNNNQLSSNNSRTRPPQPEPPQTQEDRDNMNSENQSTFKSPVRRTSSRSRSQTETPVSAGSSTAHTQQRGSSRRGKKRSSPVHRDDDLPPLPKRISTDSSMVSESDDMSTHLQVDATPTVAAKTLRRTRKKNGSQIDLSVVDENTTASRPQRNSKRSARSRILESFRESPLARGSKRILDNIAEAFSPKSPTKEDNPNSSRIDSKENLATPSNLEVTEKKPSGRGRGRHKLYKEDTFISEPMEFTGGFVRSPDDVHKTVTRSLRSRKH